MSGTSDSKPCPVCGHETERDRPVNRIGKVVVTVRGGVAEVESYPDDVKVEIRDYDNESEDPLIVSTYEIKDPAI